jgi:hypothetical protein
MVGAGPDLLVLRTTRQAGQDARHDDGRADLMLQDRRTLRHTTRTAVQVIAALGGGIPAIAAAFNLPAGLVAKITAVFGVILLAVTAGQNSGEEAGVLPVLLPNPVAEAVEDAPSPPAIDLTTAVNEDDVDPDMLGGV